MSRKLILITVLLCMGYPLGVLAKQQAGPGPLPSFSCGLFIDAGPQGFFGDCSGMGSENEIIEHKVVTPEGIEVVRKIPGRLLYSDLVLKRGITANTEMWTWRQQVEEGGILDARKDGDLVLFDQEGNEVARWRFLRAWPASIVGSSVGVEEVKIVYESVTRVD